LKGEKTMDENLLKQMRSEAEQLFQVSIERVNPYEAVKRFVRLDGNRLIFGQGGGPVLNWIWRNSIIFS